MISYRVSIMTKSLIFFAFLGRRQVLSVTGGLCEGKQCKWSKSLMEELWLMDIDQILTGSRRDNRPGEGATARITRE